MEGGIERNRRITGRENAEVGSDPTKAGAGALTLSGANTYTGGTTLSAGELNINSSSAIGTGSLVIDAGTAIDNTGAVTFVNGASGDFTLDVTSTGLTTFSNALGSPTPLASLSITTATLSAGDIATTGGVTRDRGRNPFLNWRTSPVTSHMFRLRDVVLDRTHMVLLKDGHIIEEGSHDLLVKVENGLYQRLWSLQATDPVPVIKMPVEAP